MVLITSGRQRQLGVFALVLGTVAPAAAQDLGRATPLLDVPKEYAATPIHIGPASLTAAMDVRAEYDSNIYALPSNEIDDVRFNFLPRLNLTMDSGTFSLGARAAAQIRRYAEHDTENSESGVVGLEGGWRMSTADTLSFKASAARTVEERGEPESRRNPASPPRKSNFFEGSLGYKHQGPRIGLSLTGTALRNNALSASDEERDYKQYSAVARAGVRASGTVMGFVEGFYTKRDFDLPTDFSGVDRDSHTVGGRAGIAIDPGGMISGEAAVGIFRFNPDDPLLSSRSGLSVTASLVYQPTQRLAFTLDGFRGDVATVRTGAQSRTDTRFRFGVQQEIYHNLHANAAVIYRQTKFVGSGASERTLGATAELEYLMNRHVAIALQGGYGDRNSNDPLDESERANIGVELRLQY